MSGAVLAGRSRAHDDRGSAAFRARFPLLESRVHLASCSVAARSRDLDASLAQMLDDLAGGTAWELFEEQVRAARRGFADLIGARPDQVALMPSASVGAYQVASVLDWDTRPVIVTTSAEFPSIAHVWLAQQPRGATVVMADPSGYPGEISERTKLVSVPLTTYATGDRLPVADIAAAAHACGALVFVDAYQALGNEAVDVDRLGCDFLVAGSMKYLLGLPGLAFLYARSADAVDRDPQLTGWFGRVNPFAFDPRQLDFPPGATRYETGTPAVPACYAANAGLRMIAQLDMVSVRRHICGLTGYAVARLAELGERVTASPDPGARGAHIGITHSQPAALAAFLADRNIAVSPRGGIVRLSFHYYNDYEDVAALCEGISSYQLWQEGLGHSRTSR